MQPNTWIKEKKKSSPMVPVVCNLHFSFKVCSHYLLISLRIPHHHLGVFWPLYKGDAKKKARPYFHNPKKPTWLASQAPSCPLSVTSFLYFIFWLWWVFLATHWLSLVAVSRGYSLLWCEDSLGRLLLWGTGSKCVGFSSCSTRAL